MHQYAANPKKRRGGGPSLRFRTGWEIILKFTKDARRLQRYDGLLGPIKKKEKKKREGKGREKGGPPTRKIKKKTSHILSENVLV